MEKQEAILGGIEAGGTNYRCVLGNARGDIIESVTFPTGAPEPTLDKALAFFAAQPVRIAALGVGHFGPVDIDPRSRRFGHVLKTPKPGWSDFDVLSPFRRIGVPTVFQSDVNAAAVGEAALGAAQGLRNFVYVTVGTGIGGGVVINGQLLHAARHPEIGHMRVGRDVARDDFVGCCPFHRDCLEGLASGPALKGRWGVPAEQLPPDHQAWALEAHYLATLGMNLCACYSPDRIIFGGGVLLQQPHLTPMIRERYLELMNGYLQASVDTVEDFIVASPLQGNAATRGALILAGQALSGE
jgi:fructokinase